MARYTLDSGREVLISYASWKDASKLKNAIVNAFQQVSIDGLDLDALKGLKSSGDAMKALKNVELSGDLVDSVKNALCALISNEEIEASILQCLHSSSYVQPALGRIQASMFDDSELVEDWHELAILCVKENVLPFFKRPGAALKLLAPAKIKTSKSQK